MENDLLMRIIFQAVFAGGEFLRGQKMFSHISGKVNVEELDVRVGEVIKSVLQHSSYEIFSEEVDDSAFRGRQEYFWWVDPIDGTRGFLAGEKDYGLSVGLIASGNIPVLGVVYQPAYEKLFYGCHGQGSYVKDLMSGGGERRLKVTERASEGLVGILGTQSTLQMQQMYEQMRIAEHYGPIGSFTTKVLAIAEGRADVYLKSGNKCNEWDSCAVDVILREAGGRMTDLQGENLRYNKADPNFAKGVLASNGVCHELMLRRLEEWICK